MRAVETAVATLPGVLSARANLSAKRVSIVTATGGPGVVELANALERKGFRAADIAAAGSAASTPAGKGLHFSSCRSRVRSREHHAVVGLGLGWPGVRHGPGGASLFHWLSALIALPAVAYAGQPFFRSAFDALSARRLNMDVPISLGVLLATGMSLYQTAAAPSRSISTPRSRCCSSC